MFGKIAEMVTKTPSLQIRVRQGHQVTVIPCNKGKSFCYKG